MYLVNIHGGDKPTELTSGKHGATRSPVLSKQGDKAAWLQLDKDGAEADRFVSHTFFSFLYTERSAQGADRHLRLDQAGQVYSHSALGPFT